VVRISPAPWDAEQLDQLYYYTELRVRQWLDGGLLVLVIEGHLGSAEAAGEFTALLLQAGEAPIRGVVLDMRLVSFVPSKALPGLIALRTRLAQRGGLLAVVAGGERLSRVLGLVGLEKAILITPDPRRAWQAARECMQTGGGGEGA